MELHEREMHERFTRLWTEVQPVVGGYIHSVVRDPATADDLLQNVAVILLRRFSEYDDRRPFVAWALGVAQFQILSLQRDRARSCLVFHPDLLDQLAETQAELAPELEARGLALQECLKHLGERARTVTELRYLDELKPAQIAERLGIGAIAVRVMLNRARNCLRTCIERKVKLES